VKHFGWLRPSDRHAKYKRNRTQDPGGPYADLYASILDPDPHLEDWVD
jgi:hypothetical protein